MRDYEELVRCLRGHSQKMGCADNCICEDADKRGFGTCSEELAKLAADAIEELQKRAPKAPHGRLIDADALIGTIRPLCEEDKFAACTFETVKRLMKEHINNAPIIVPAEEGE